MTNQITSVCFHLLGCFHFSHQLIFCWLRMPCIVSCLTVMSIEITSLRQNAQKHLWFETQTNRSFTEKTNPSRFEKGEWHCASERRGASSGTQYLPITSAHLHAHNTVHGYYCLCTLLLVTLHWKINSIAQSTLYMYLQILLHPLICVRPTIYCTEMHTIACAVHTLFWALHSVQCTLCNAHCALLQ